MQRCLPSSGAAQRSGNWSLGCLPTSRQIRVVRQQQQNHQYVQQQRCAAAVRNDHSSTVERPTLLIGQRIAAAAAAGLILLIGGPSECMAAPSAATSPSQAAAVVCHQQVVVGDIAGLFGGGDEAGAPEPFTLYGSNFKMYSIEKLDGEKVVSRSRGFTVDTCVSAIDETAESPEFQGMAPGDKLRSGDNLLCKRATGQNLKQACASSCKEACGAALDAEAAKQQAETGLQLSASDRKRVQRTCQRQCNYGCIGSGKTHDFVTPSRR